MKRIYNLLSNSSIKVANATTSVAIYVNEKPELIKESTIRV